MNDRTSSPGDDPLAAMLREHAPKDLPDDGFSARTMHAIARASRPRSPPRTQAPALAVEHRRHAAQARLMRWGFAGAITGGLLAAIAVLVMPTRDAAEIVTSSILPHWEPLSLTLCAGALWFAWREWIGLVR